MKGNRAARLCVSMFACACNRGRGRNTHEEDEGSSTRASSAIRLSFFPSLTPAVIKSTRPWTFLRYDRRSRGGGGSGSTSL